MDSLADRTSDSPAGRWDISSKDNLDVRVDIRLLDYSTHKISDSSANGLDVRSKDGLDIRADVGL